MVDCNIRESGKIHRETVVSDCWVYILLIRTKSAFSRFVKAITGAEYTHTSIGMEADCETLYSFARRYEYLPLPAGFVKEHINTGLMGRSKSAPCVLYRVKVSREAKLKLIARLEGMFAVRKKYSYSLSGPFLCYFNVAIDYKDKFFCSQFAAQALYDVGAIKLLKPASLYRPMDFLKQPEFELCYRGTLGELAKSRYM